MSHHVLSGALRTLFFVAQAMKYNYRKRNSPSLHGPRLRPGSALRSPSGHTFLRSLSGPRPILHNPCPSIPGLHPAPLVPFHNRDVKPCRLPAGHPPPVITPLPAPSYPAQIYRERHIYDIRCKQCVRLGSRRYAYHIDHDAIYSSAASRSTVTCAARASAMESVVPAETF